MTENQLRSLTGNLIMISEYSDSAKKQLLGLVLESSGDQLKSITLDVIDHINEDNFINTGKNILSMIGKNPVTTYYLVTSMIDISAKLYKNLISQTARACATAQNKEECAHKYKMKALNAQIQKLMADLPLCRTAKNPDKCVTSINKKINNLKFKLRKMK